MTPQWGPLVAPVPRSRNLQPIRYRDVLAAARESSRPQIPLAAPIGPWAARLNPPDFANRCANPALTEKTDRPTEIALAAMLPVRRLTQL